MSLKILLINPPYKPGKRFTREGRCTQESTFWFTSWPPYSLASMAAGLRSEHRVKILDCPAQEIREKELLAFVFRYRPDCVISSLSTQTLDSDLNILETIKKSVRTRVAVFGVHATVFAEELVRGGVIDFVIRNEPELTALELMKALEQDADLEKVQGIAFKKPDGTAVLTPARPYISDLDSLPFPAWDLVDLSRYTLPFFGRRFVIVTNLRGCPFSCSFCNARVYYGEKARVRSAENIIEEIQFLIARFHIRDVFFWGDTFTLNRPQIQALCDGLIQQHIDIRWVANSRVDTVDRDLLRKMRRAGCWLLSYGIESGDDGILGSCGKNTSVDKIRETVALTREAGIKIAGHFILGLPGETEATAEKTIGLARELKLDFANFYSAVPFPGTSLYEDAKAKGWLENAPWSRFHQSHFVMDLPTISRGRLETLKKKAYYACYLRPGSFKTALSMMTFRSISSSLVNAFRYIVSFRRKHR